MPNYSKPNMKIPAYIPDYFSGQKGVQEKYLYVYGGKNKSGLLAVKKPAYGKIKITANNRL